ncbi:MAG: pyridoxamine 5'-phosphate oxidase family protein [Candidatus Limnocylindrales bacterium]
MTDGSTWADFEGAAPEIARRGRELMYRTGEGEGLLVTVRGDDPPRVHPVNVGVVGGRLYTFVQGKSAKRRELDQDGRYALHTHMDPHAPSEFMVRGHARVVEDEATRSAVAAVWFFNVNESYPLYELLIEHALLGERPTANDWPPVYSSWRP